MSDLRATIRDRMSGKSIDELIEIWRLNDGDQWSAETFGVIRELLEERGASIPAQEAWPRPAVTKSPAPFDGTARRFNLAIGSLFWIGGGNLLFGILRVAGIIGEDQEAWTNFATAAVFLTLGYLARRRSIVALRLGMVSTVLLLVASIVWLVVILTNGGLPLGLGSTPLLIVCLIWQGRGLRAMRELSDRTPESPPFRFSEVSVRAPAAMARALDRISADRVRGGLRTGAAMLVAGLALMALIELSVVRHFKFHALAGGLAYGGGGLLCSSAGLALWKRSPAGPGDSRPRGIGLGRLTLLILLGLLGLVGFLVTLLAIYFLVFD